MDANDESTPGVWMAYFSDWSSFVLFDSEIEALRHAVNNMMDVKRVAYGQEARS